MERLLLEAVEESKKMLEIQLELARDKLAEAEQVKAERAAAAAAAEADKLERAEHEADGERARELMGAVAEEISKLRLSLRRGGPPVVLVERAVAPLVHEPGDDR